MILDDLGRQQIKEQDILELFYRGLPIPSKIVTSDTETINLFNKNIEEFNYKDKINIENINITKKEFDKNQQKIWFMPDKYKNINLINYFDKFKKNEVASNRIKLELDLFKKNNLLDLLKYMIYLVDVMRENNIVWGVGRGSSVSSYLLYLIGIHKINSIKYNLSIYDFLK